MLFTGAYSRDILYIVSLKGRGGDQNRPDRYRDNQSRAAPAPVDNDEASWDEPSPAVEQKPQSQPTVTSKPLAQSTPSNTPAKPTVQSPVKSTVTAQQMVATAALPLNKEVLVRIIVRASRK